MAIITPKYDPQTTDFRYYDNCVNPVNSQYDFFYSTISKTFIYKKDTTTTTVEIDMLNFDNPLIIVEPKTNNIMLTFI